MQVGDPVKVKNTNFKCDLVGVEVGDLGLVRDKEVNMRAPANPYVHVLMVNGIDVVFMQDDLEVINESR
tara:strand:- start:2866 stop:3072 length:207 start_codon:yes stop_codon:yes gene_type:complete